MTGGTHPPVPGRTGQAARRRLASLRWMYPAYFALVMATGIVSMALHDIRQAALSETLLVISVLCLVVLTAELVVRVVVFPHEVAADLSAPDRAYSFFTLVAAFCVVGTRIAVGGMPTAAEVLGGIGFVAWAALGYGIPARLVLGPRDGPVLAGVNGNWFIWVVGTQALVVTLADVGTAFPGQTRPYGLVAVLLWSTGVVLYLIIAALVLTRLLLMAVRPRDLTPSYWVMMGATAITVVAAGHILAMPASPMIRAARPIIVGLAVVLWAFGTWLMPLLVVFGIWRHALRHARLEYRPQLWSIVFPLGMYAVASIELGKTVRLPIVETIGRAWVWVAFPAWALTFVAMVVALARGVRHAPPADAGPPSGDG